MKRTKIVLAAILTCLSLFISEGVFSQVVVKVKPTKAKTTVIKPRKPSKNFVWIEGHWKWSKKTNRYIWVGGHWVKKPSSKHRWVPGHWRKAPGGWKFIPGHWA